MQIALACAWHLSTVLFYVVLIVFYFDTNYCMPQLLISFYVIFILFELICCFMFYFVIKFFYLRPGGLEPRPSDRKSSTLTTRLSRHPDTIMEQFFFILCCLFHCVHIIYLVCFTVCLLSCISCSLSATVLK